MTRGMEEGHFVKTTTERFWAKVDKNGPVQPHCPELGSCWVWTAYLNPGGYGAFGWPLLRKTITAHRAAWLLEHGEIPEGLCVLHRCDHRRCVRIDHLFLGTLADNIADMHAKGRESRGDTHRSRTRPDSVVRGERHWSRRDPSLVARGTATAHAKLTDDAVREIRMLASIGFSQYAIASMFGVSQRTISRAVRMECWKHVA